MFVITSPVRLWNEGNDDLSRKLFPFLYLLLLEEFCMLMRKEGEDED